MDISTTSTRNTEPPLRLKTRDFRRAFSLVEVVMAIGITAFAAVSIAGLIPVGLGSFRQTKNMSTASDISRLIFSDLNNTTFTNLTASQQGSASAWRLPAPNAVVNTGGYSNTYSDTTYIRNFDEQGTEIASSTTNAGAPVSALYQVNVRVAYASFSQSPTGAAIANPNLLVVTIQVALNPGRLPLALDSATNTLWTGFSATGVPVQIFTYQTFVAGDPTPPVS
jgi:uncharacterized protein (TIGR02598 family)